MGGLERARGLVVFAEEALEQSAARDGHSGGEGGLLLVGVKANDGHRRSGAEVKRVNGFQQGLRETREFRIEFQVNARGEPGKAFQQAFNVRIRTNLFGVFVEGKTAGDFRKFAGEFAGHFAEVAKLGVVVLERPLIHWNDLPGMFGRSPGRWWS